MRKKKLVLHIKNFRTPINCAKKSRSTHVVVLGKFFTNITSTFCVTRKLSPDYHLQAYFTGARNTTNILCFSRKMSVDNNPSTNILGNLLANYSRRKYFLVLLKKQSLYSPYLENARWFLIVARKSA